MLKLLALSPSLKLLDLSGCFHITTKIFDAFKHDDHPVELILGGTHIQSSFAIMNTQYTCSKIVQIVRQLNIKIILLFRHLTFCYMLVKIC